ncbi:hypothetical protein SDC9_41892 [bioreactor metagenome]|uniref:DUF2326 domain-containing protein n=1 Tax=bioreactor metagenome TaxID=1076179 RepID=A0A644VWY5_9ZZZZ|nr:DUF2326 domain-containing protein [Desulfitobacterium hafniense]MEA5024108.1 DUF2326 domain-containing protein [Desulfitobacterium hafniense]
MLDEIICEKFKEKRIKFHDGLNTILGTNTGDNSIGKSSFLLIVDFVFGGNTYAHANDIIKNIGEHEICFSFKFNNESFFFSREVINHHKVWQCNEKYEKQNSMNTEEFCDWLDKQYKIQLPYLTFRNIVSRYIRVYGKDNANEKLPLHSVSNEKMKDACYALLKLFDNYMPIHSLAQQANKSNEELKAYQKAQTFNFISNIGKRDFSKNEKELERLNDELEELAKDVERGFADLDAEISEEAIRIKKLLSRTRRLRSGVKSRLETIKENAEYKFSVTTSDFQNLLAYFPDANVRKIEDIEGFHNKISSVFKEELSLERRKLEKELGDYNNLVNEYEKQLEELIQNPKLSKTVLSRHSELLRQINHLQKENKAYVELSRLKTIKKEDEERLSSVRQKQFAVLANELNTKMKAINQFIYGENYNSPVIDFSENSYSFFTPDDTGTGIAYKGLVVFDLAVLELTKLPIVVHDSIVLKQISDIAIEKILELYDNSGKQVIIALDKQNSYTEKANKILNTKSVLHLAPNGDELFGRSWG